MIDIEDPEIHFNANMRLVRNTNTVSLLNLCAMTVPVGLDAAGMPVECRSPVAPTMTKTSLALALA